MKVREGEERGKRVRSNVVTLIPQERVPPTTYQYSLLTHNDAN